MSINSIQKSYFIIYDSSHCLDGTMIFIIECLQSLHLKTRIIASVSEKN